MAEGTVVFEIIASAKGVKVVQKQTDALAKSSDKASKSTDKLSKSRDTYHRKEKGAAQISSNQTKNFSKMQQGIDGGGGSGGLVRAYALLAANVFALTAAFGVLSRSAQIDTLVESMEVLSTTGGTYIKSVARDMQEASGFAIDLAQSFRQVSLAASAGLNTSEIEGLTMVAKGAAISLGRNLPDAMDRIFRGAIKLEPEILDEIGLFIRVDEAAQKFARNNGKVTSSLTQVEKRQAFLNEILEQGTRKFQQYAEEIKPDPYVRLGAALGDIAQGGLSILNSVLGPLLSRLAESKGLLTAVFGILVFSLVKKAIPALGQFNQNIAKNATEAADNAREYTEGLKASTTVEVQEANKKLAKKKELLEADRKLSDPKARNQGRQGAIDKSLKTEMDADKRKTLLMQKRDLLLKKINTKNIKNRDILKADLIDMDRELDNLKEQERIGARILANEEKGRIDPSQGSVAQRRQAKLDDKATSTTILAGASNKAELKGMSAGFKELNSELKLNKDNLGFASRSMTRFTGTISILGTGISKVMMILGPWMMALSILSPVILKIGRAMGFGSEAMKAYDEEMKKLSEQFENLDKRFKAQVKGMKDMNLTYRENLKAATAFMKSQTETAKGILELEKQFKTFMEEANGFQRWWEGTKNWFGFGRENAKIKLQLDGTKESLIALAEAGRGSLLEVFDEAGVNTKDYTTALQNSTDATKLANEQNKLWALTFKNNVGFATNMNQEMKFMSDKFTSVADATAYLEKRSARYSKEIEKMLIANFAANNGLKLTNSELKDLGITQEQSIEISENLSKKTEAIGKAMANLESAIKGTQESVGKFNQSFMPKTKVDDILGSFDSVITKVDELKKISEEDVKGFFEGFADADNPFKGLFKDMFTEAVDADGNTVDVLKDTVDTATIEKALTNVQKEFKEYRVTIIKAKTELKALKQTEKNFASISGAGRAANLKQQNAITEQATKQVETAEKLTDITLRNIGYDRTSFTAKKELIDAEKDETKRAELLTQFKLTEIDLLAVENQFNEEKIKQLDEQIKKATEKFRIDLQENQELQKVLTLEKGLTDLKRTQLGLELELAAARTGGSVRPLDTSMQTIAAAKEAYDFEVDSFNLKKLILEAEHNILMARTKVILLEAGMAKKNEDGTIEVDASAKAWMDALGEGFNASNSALDAGLKNAALRFAIATTKGISDSISSGGGGLTNSIRALSAGVAATGKDGKIKTGGKNEDGSEEVIDGLTLQDARVQLLRTSYKQLAETMAQFGPTGAIVAGVAQGSLSIMTAMENQAAGNKVIADAVADTTNKFGENDVAMAKGAQTAEMVGGVMSGVGQMLAANSKGQIAELDQQIAAEKRRDGQSKESLAKIAQMEKKKEAMQKKAFEQNKKVQMAVTIANTAASIMAALSAPPIGLGPAAGMPMAIMAGAMGALQLAVIAKTKYQGGGGQVQQPSATSLSIGKRSNNVDVSRGASGGELSYMRGERGVGSNANNFTPGGAMGRKGYAAGGEGILVGERGPEVVTPSQKVDVIPNDKLGGSTNVNFSINAVDATGVEDLLVNQRGNIIRMIREAANENGEDFLTQVDPMAYGSNS